MDSLVRAKVENSYHQMKEAARQEVEHIRQQAGNDQKALQDHVLERLQQLQHEKQTVEMREQQKMNKPNNGVSRFNSKRMPALHRWQRATGN